MTQTSPIRLTALIDTYNYGHFIEEAIDSVLAQDFPPEQMEILVVDDENLHLLWREILGEDAVDGVFDEVAVVVGVD